MPKLVDLSHWNPVTDWDKLAKQVDGVICKCTQGTGYLDPTYKTYKKEAQKRGLFFGAYHFADGGNLTKEADWFLRNVGEVDMKVLDWEIENPDPVGWSKDFLKRIESDWLYTNDARAVKYSWPKEWRFWIARYGVNNGLQSTKPAFKNWTIWQFTSRGKLDGVSGYVDLNYSKEDLKPKIEPKPEPIPEPTPEPEKPPVEPPVTPESTPKDEFENYIPEPHTQETPPVDNLVDFLMKIINFILGLWR